MLRDEEAGPVSCSETYLEAREEAATWTCDLQKSAGRVEGGGRRGRNWGSTTHRGHVTAEDPIWGQGLTEMAPRCAGAAQGIGGCVYFRVYGKRLGRHTLRNAENAPHPLRKWGGEQQGCG